MTQRLAPLPFVLPFAVLVAGCGIPINEIVPMRDGTLRATTYIQAAEYCRKKNATATAVGKAPAETGVIFRCE